MAVYEDLLAAIARVRAGTGDADGWMRGLSGADPAVAANLVAVRTPGAIDTVLAKIRGGHPELFDPPPADAPSGGPTERIRLGLRAHLLMLLSGDDAVYVLLYEWRALSGPARDEMVRLRDRYEAFWDGMLYEAAGAGRVRPGVDLKLVRLYGFGAVNWVATWYTPGGERTPEQIADAFWAYLALGLLADDKRPADVQAAQGAFSALQTSPAAGTKE